MLAHQIDSDIRSIKHFSELQLKDLPLVGGKNASLGEMFSQLSSKGIAVPDGFAITAKAYWSFLNQNNLTSALSALLAQLDLKTFDNLSEIGAKARQLVLGASFPESLKTEILAAHHQLIQRIGADKTLAVRSSATAEDLPNASFAGQQETYLNVSGEDNLIKACHRCYASLFTDRAIKYRVDNGFDHMKVALSIGVQLMIRADLACSGVIFTLDPDSGFENVVLVSGAWGLGENVVQGSVNADEFLVFKPLLNQAKQPVLAHKLGSKLKTMVYSSKNIHEIVTQTEDAIINIETPPRKKRSIRAE